MDGGPRTSKDRPVLAVALLSVAAVGCAVLVALAVWVLVHRAVGGGGSTRASTRATAVAPQGSNGGTIDAPLVVGRDTYRSGDTVINVLSFDAHAARGAAPAPGTSEWAAIEVRTCIAAGADTSGGRHYSVANDPWTLTGSGDTAFPPTNLTDSQFPQPVYPSAAQEVSPGECVTGWIVFAVPTDNAVRLIRYYVDTPTGTNTAYWTPYR